MHAIRVLLTGTASLALLVGQAGVGVAQDSEQGAWATPVTGQRLTLTTDSADLEYTEDGGYGQGRNYVSTETWQWSDPRLPGDMTSVLNFDASIMGEWPGQVIRGRLLLEGPDGSWTGTQDAVALSDETGLGMVLLSGQGAYDGLSAVLVLRTDDPDCVECLQAEGFIHEGALTPLPD